MAQGFEPDFIVPHHCSDTQARANQENAPEVKSPANQEDVSEARTSENRRKASEAKIRANHKNAQKSTGPRTPQGKRNSSRNAAKHRILVGEIVSFGPDENIEDFHKLHQDLDAEYEPQGRVEELLVERIATCFWKLKRVLRAEHGQLSIEKIELGDRLVAAKNNTFNADFAVWRAMVEGSNAGKNDQKMTPAEQAVARQKVILNLQRTFEGVVLLNSFLQTIKDEIQTTGSVSTEKRRLLSDTLCDDLELLLRDEHNLKDPKRREILVNLIDHKLADLDRQKGLITERDWLRNHSELRRMSVPLDDSMDRILRYETLVERQLFRAMDQLERIQRRRRGESVPAPLRLSIGK